MILHPLGCIRITVQQHVELRKGTVDIGGTILNNLVPKEPWKPQKKKIVIRSIDNMGGREGIK